MSHTPASNRLWGIYNGYQIAVSGEDVHVADCWYDEDAEQIIAEHNFFHSNDGRAIDTDKIPQGGFWEMVNVLQLLLARWDTFTGPERDGWGNMENAYYDLAKHAQGEWRLARALLDQMGVR